MTELFWRHFHGIGFVAALVAPALAAVAVDWAMRRGARVARGQPPR